MKTQNPLHFTLIRLVPFIVLVAFIMGAPLFFEMSRLTTVIIGLALALASRFLLMALFKNGDRP